MADWCTYVDDDATGSCPHAATHASIVELWDPSVWTPYDCTWPPADHEAEFCRRHSEYVSADRTRRSEEAADALAND